MCWEGFLEDPHLNHLQAILRSGWEEVRASGGIIPNKPFTDKQFQVHAPVQLAALRERQLAAAADDDDEEAGAPEFDGNRRRKFDGKGRRGTTGILLFQRTGW